MPSVSDGKNSGNSFLLPLPRENFLATAAKRFFRNFFRHLPTASVADVLNVESVTASRQYFRRRLNFLDDGMPTVLLIKFPSIFSLGYRSFGKKFRKQEFSVNFSEFNSDNFLCFCSKSQMTSRARPGGPRMRQWRNGVQFSSGSH